MKGQQAHRRLEERAVHALAEPGLLPLDHRRADAQGAEHACREVEKGHARANRLPAGLARDGHDAGEGLHEGLVAGRVLARPGAAERGDRTVDQPRIDRRQRLVAEAEALHGARAEVLDEDVGRPDERLDHVHRLGRLEIERHAALVAVEEQVGRGLAVLVRGPGAGLVARARVLDLDDVGPKIGEEGPAPGTGDDAGEIEDADAVEREWEGGHARYYTLPRATLHRQ
jgi:hypothetical protein